MRIPLLLSFLALTIGLRAQTTFAPEGATWTYSVFNPWTGSSFPITFTALGDTTVLEHMGTFLITVWTDHGEVLSQRVVVR